MRTRSRCFARESSTGFRYGATVNAVVAIWLSHQIVKFPPCCVISVNVTISWSAETGCVVTCIVVRNTSMSGV